ncbi:SRPBCC family protein [Novosphingobium sp. G106]|uniref:SRPBCC family protein n=1 Tax=Novosphingobium sp. G106 TaxID=2849500 RepID=UPI001C2D790F|nr:SRPBCC family protein [Novosphingobium sp. G106]MBV1690334.1 SRPBCC family protein [Novosphingobium sp. G106]
MTAHRDAGGARHDDAPVTTSKDTHPDRALVAESVTINRPAEELYAFWRQSANLVAVMDNIASIQPIDETRSRWTVKAPAGREVSWESVITKDVPGKEITWQSAPGADVANAGRIEFQDAGARGTVVRAVIAYDPPGGAIGQFIAKLFQREPRLQARRDLRRFKQLMETGEIATSSRTAKQFAEEKA